MLICLRPRVARLAIPAALVPKIDFGSAALVARPSVTCCVQAVGTRKLIVVGERHLAHDLCHETRGIHGTPVRIPWAAALDYGIGAVGTGRCGGYRTEDAGVTKRARESTTIGFVEGATGFPMLSTTAMTGVVPVAVC